MATHIFIVTPVAQLLEYSIDKATLAIWAAVKKCNQSLPLSATFTCSTDDQLNFTLSRYVPYFPV